MVKTAVKSNLRAIADEPVPIARKIRVDGSTKRTSSLSILYQENLGFPGLGAEEEKKGYFKITDITQL